ncbi:MAG: carbohydrate ABC transporter permease [Chloroflexi bacterium]|nr:carbohydrate ABC transporter permease [Chloroflexota bacterium]
MTARIRWTVFLSHVAYIVLLTIGLVVFAFPLYWMLRSSLVDLATFVRRPLIWLPIPLTFESYRRIWKAFDLLKVIGNTAAIAITMTAGNLLIDSMAGYGFAKTEFPGKNAIFALFLATLMLGFEVLMIPEFLIIKRLGLYDTFPAIVLPGMASTFSIFLMRQFFSTIPNEIEESAFIDGAGRFRIFFNIALPMSKPALATIGVLHFLGGWESYLWPLIITSPSGRLQVMQTVIARATQMAGPAGTGAGDVLWPDLMAASLISALPIFFLFLFAQRYFVAGLTGGALKG